jgi:hypothetical protein
VWPVALSGRLPVIALVGHHPTNKLIGREPIPGRKNFPPTTMRQQVISGISPRFRGLSRSLGQVTHVLLTRSPLEYPRRGLSARLACVKHAASVRPEPGSNSPTKTLAKNAKNKTKKHWLNRHPVEFSKNNHTPDNRPNRTHHLGLMSCVSAGRSLHASRPISRRQIELRTDVRLARQTVRSYE